MRKSVSCRGFTLIELLIVVAIIAILAAIAIPNFLVAQTRAKVARAKGDMNSLATAVESYLIDNNIYPYNGDLEKRPIFNLTSPVSYISSLPQDPFQNLFAWYTTEQEALLSDPNYNTNFKNYYFMQIFSLGDLPGLTGGWNLDILGGNYGALRKYGKWELLSLGPDRIFVGSSPEPIRFDGYGYYDGLFSPDIAYDPSNGTVSFGNIMRTQLNPSGLGVTHLP